MKFEETIQTMFDVYPDLFQYRYEALNQLFCVIGNGFDWINGQLVDEEDGIIFIGRLDGNGKAIQRNNNVFYYEFREKFTKRFGEWKHSFYPLCREYSYLLNFPKDIQPDWLEGIKETYQYIFDNYNESKDSKFFNDISIEELKEIYKEKFGE